MLLTSATTVVGLGPLIFETSLQAQFLIPMAVSLAFGIGFATVLVLLFTPALLSAHESLHRLISRWLYPAEAFAPQREVADAPLRYTSRQGLAEK